MKDIMDKDHSPTKNSFINPLPDGNDTMLIIKQKM